MPENPGQNGGTKESRVAMAQHELFTRETSVAEEWLKVRAPQAWGLPIFVDKEGAHKFIEGMVCELYGTNAEKLASKLRTSKGQKK